LALAEETSISQFHLVEGSSSQGCIRDCHLIAKQCYVILCIWTILDVVTLVKRMKNDKVRRMKITFAKYPDGNLPRLVGNKPTGLSCTACNNISVI